MSVPILRVWDEATQKYVAFPALKGERGVAGANGKDGADGKTPIKGTDYFTAADKQEMVDSVLAALPKWNGGTY